MPISRFFVGRLASAPGNTRPIVASAIIFFITTVLPGDVATRILGRAPAADQLAILRLRLGLNEPAIYRYLAWLANFLRGDLGVSLVTGQPVVEIVGRRLGNTALLSIVALGDVLSIGGAAGGLPGGQSRPVRGSRHLRCHSRNSCRCYRTSCWELCCSSPVRDLDPPRASALVDR